MAQSKYTTIGNKEYSYFIHRVKFKKAEENCNDSSKYDRLAVVKDRQTRDNLSLWVKDNYGGKNGYTYTWIGVKGDEMGTKWLDGTPYKSSLTNAKDECGALYSNFTGQSSIQFFNCKDSHTLDYICERTIIQETPGEARPTAPLGPTIQSTADSRQPGTNVPTSSAQDDIRRVNDTPLIAGAVAGLVVLIALVLLLLLLKRKKQQQHGKTSAVSYVYDVVVDDAREGPQAPVVDNEHFNTTFERNYETTYAEIGDEHVEENSEHNGANDDAINTQPNVTYAVVNKRKPPDSSHISACGAHTSNEPEVMQSPNNSKKTNQQSTSTDREQGSDVTGNCEYAVVNKQKKSAAKSTDVYAVVNKGKKGGLGTVEAPRGSFSEDSGDG